MQNAADTAYRSGIDAAVEDANATIQDAEAKLRTAANSSSRAVTDAETAYQKKRISDAKAALKRLDKAQADDDAAQKAEAEAAQKAAADAAADKKTAKA